MKKIITISGNLGSGKSTVSRYLSNDFGYAIISIGDLFRKIAEEKGMTINDFSEYIKDKPEYDKKIDEQVKEIGTQSDNLIFVSRVAWHFIPDSFNIFLYVDERVGTKRILDDTSRVGEKYIHYQEALEKIHRRFENSKIRYLKEYGIDITNPDNYDLYLDTTFLTPEQVTEIIVQEYIKYLSKNNKKKEV